MSGGPNFRIGRTEFMENAVRMGGPGDPDTAQLDGPIIMDGVMYVPAMNCMAVTRGKASEPETHNLIMLLANLGLGMGSAVPMSSTHARQFGAMLISMADLIDANAARQADAALAKAAGKGGA